MGRPNVGKSSLVNRILREERVLVSEVAGTTRDSIDATFRWHRRQFRIVDTAGIRRPGRVARAGQVEAVSVLSARRAIADADVVVLVIDATEGAADQDGAIAGEAERAGRSVVIAVNKWDLVKVEGQDFAKTFDDELRFRLKFLDFAPIVHVSAHTGERTPKLLEVIDHVMRERMRRVPTPELNRFIGSITAAHPPPSPERRAVRICAADVCVLHQYRDEISFLIRAVFGQQAAGEIRLPRHAASPASAAEEAATTEDTEVIQSGKP